MKIILSNGGGTNSTAILVGLYERGETIDLQLFADTGDEKPHTYAHLQAVSEWCVNNGLPPVTIIRAQQPQQLIDGSLSEECLRLGKLPSKAYGFGACSMKWKIEPQERWIRKWITDNGITETPTRLIGYDADEIHRSQKTKNENLRFPLIEWGWGREECIEAIARAGLPQPGKSSCFMCPSAKKWEILELADRYPNLMERALEMERRALAGEGQSPQTTGKGLGRQFAWSDVLKARDKQCVLEFSDAGTPEVDCGCYDG